MRLLIENKLLFCTLIIIGRGDLMPRPMLEDWLDLSAPDDARELITSQGYPFEEHSVVTTDHYILKIHRIPQGHSRVRTSSAARGSRKVVYVQHGLLSSSDDWVLNHPNQSLGFMLADAGFDVWLGNVRGNKYGLNHTTLRIQDAAFWKFSFDEMAKFDLPAIADYISNVTNTQQIYYVGHSQGTLMAFIRFSQNPAWTNLRIKQFHALAPVFHFKRISGAFKYIAPLTSTLAVFFRLTGENDFLPNSRLMTWLADKICGSVHLEFICTDIIFLIAGYDAANMNSSRLPVYVSHTPAGTSARNMAHFGQVVNAKRTQEFDYGYIWNLIIYGSLWPPVYSLDNLTVPTALYWGDQDILADPKDVAQLQLDIHSHVFVSYKIVGASHLDFIWGLNAAPDVYSKVLRLLLQDTD